MNTRPSIMRPIRWESVSYTHLIVSLALLIFTRPFALKFINKDAVKTNVESLVGRTARVTSRICLLYTSRCV